MNDFDPARPEAITPTVGWLCVVSGQEGPIRSLQLATTESS